MAASVLADPLHAADSVHRAPAVVSVLLVVTGAVRRAGAGSATPG
ncbi:hypothetical protein [Streptomyces vietnamensis]|nr:hypothetical protein [Streptomyces vietnamensis]